MKSKDENFVLVIMLDIVIWTVTGIVACCTVNATGNPYWALLLLIAGLFQMGYKQYKD